MNNFIADYRLEKYLKRDKRFLFTIKNKDLYYEIDGHPDIFACDLGEVVIIEPNFYEQKIKDIKSLSNKKIVKGKTSLKEKYPYDIAYNFVKVGRYFIGNINAMDSVLKEYALKMNLKLIDVKQGYAKCSVLKIDEKNIITSDDSIYNSLTKIKEIDSIKISQKGIFLSDRYDGFIGGASAVFNGIIYFFGNIKKLDDYKKINDFLNQKNIKYKNLLKDINKFEDKLWDFGGFIEI